MIGEQNNFNLYSIARDWAVSAVYGVRLTSESPTCKYWGREIE